MVTKYVDALLAHKPAQLPVAADVRFTEDSQELALGDGLWKTVTGNGGFRQDYIDVRDQIAAAHVTLLEGKIAGAVLGGAACAGSQDRRHRDAGAARHARLAIPAHRARQAAAAFQ